MSERMHDSCPQCGSVVLCAYDYKKDKHDVYCTGCTVEARGFPSKEEAMDKWNEYWESEWSLGSKTIYRA